MSTSDLIRQLTTGDRKALARCISIVENESDGYEELLSSLNLSKAPPLIGITGPPGAGKSTLINALIRELLSSGANNIGVIAVDPTSPFNYGSLLGDRLRMSDHFNDPRVFIRSIATRGSLGGLSSKTIEIADVMKAAGFDYLLVETVGVGQSEVEVAGLADTTILVVVPESGDEVQTIKSGIMEIADIFVVNKSDREGADAFVNSLTQLVTSKHQEHKRWSPPVIKAVAVKSEGIGEIAKEIVRHGKEGVNDKRPFLLTEKAYRLIQNQRMKNVDKQKLKSEIEKEMNKAGFNLYVFVKRFF